MTIEEFSSAVFEITNQLGLHLVLVRLGANRAVECGCESGSIDMKDRLPADWVLAGLKPVDPDLIDAFDLRPGEMGWIRLEVPRTKGSDLLLSSIAAKSDWSDNTLGIARENPECLELFARFWPRLRKHLPHPVMVVEASGAASRSGIRASDGAKTWAERGGGLKQEGVANIHFRLVPNT